MAEDESSLQGLTALLNELYEGPLLNPRIREIQNILADFEKQESAWRSSIYYITHTKNEKVIMFCLSTLETFVLRRWMILSSEDRFTIRSFLENYLTGDMETERSNFLTLKAAKALVDIARNDCPHSYPEFFPKIRELIRSSTGVYIGLLLLNTASEEIIHPREPVNSERKLELRALLNKEAPELLISITAVLHSIFGESTMAIVRSAGTKFDESSFEAVLSASYGLFELPASVIKLCRTLLSCISSLFTWISLDSELVDHLIAGVFIFSLSTRGLLSNEGVQGDSCNEIGILALNCVQELLERNDSSNSVNKYLGKVFHVVFCHLLLITKMNKTVSEDYQIKLTEILRFLMTNFFSVMENIYDFPAVNFLASLKDFTFRNTKCLSIFFPCLEVWKVYLAIVKQKTHTFDKMTQPVAPKDKEFIIELSKSLVLNTLFNESGTHMDELEDDISDDIDANEDNCEYSQFLQESFNVLSLTCEFCPAETLELLTKYFTSYWQSYMAVSTLRIREHEMRKLHWALRDLATIMLAVAVIVESLQLDAPLELLNALVESLLYGANKAFFSVEVVKEQEIRLDFVQVHAQTLSTLRSFVAMFITWSGNSGSLKPEVEAVYVEKMMIVVAQALTNNHPSRIQYAAVSLLHTICTVLRPPQLMNSQSFDQIFSFGRQLDLVYCLRTPVARLLVQSLSTYLLVESSFVMQERDPKIEQFKGNLHEKFVASICDKCLDPYLLVNDKPTFQWCMLLLTDITQAADQLKTYSRKLCLSSLEACHTIQRLLELMDLALSNPVTCVAYLNYFVSFTHALGNSVHASILQQISNALITAFHKQTTLDSAVLDSLLSILIIIIDYRQVFIPLVGNILKLCLFHIYPTLIANDAPDGKLRLYNVFLGILCNGFSYFFKAARPTSIIDGLNKKDIFTPDHQDEFCALMQAIGSSFMLTDIEVVRANLKGLMQLNDSRRLFTIAVFRENMLYQFLKVIMDCLIEKTHDLLSDNMILCVHMMAMADCDTFFSQYLPNYIVSIDNLIDEQRNILLNRFSRDKDLPTFTISLQQLASDVIFYRMYNESLNLNTVMFSA